MIQDQRAWRAVEQIGFYRPEHSLGKANRLRQPFRLHKITHLASSCRHHVTLPTALMTPTRAARLLIPIASSPHFPDRGLIHRLCFSGIADCVLVCAASSPVEIVSMRCLYAVLFTTTIILLTSPTFAQNVGDTVVITEATPVTTDGQTVETLYAGLPVKILAAKGDSLWISHEASGWIPRTSVTSLAQADTHFTEMIAADAQNPDAFSGRALIRRHQGRFDLALADYNEALRLKPHDATTLLNRGVCSFEKGDYDKAIADYTASLRAKPDGAAAYTNRANAWKEKRAYDKAIADSTAAIRIAPTLAAAYYNRGVAWSQIPNYTQAISDFNEAILLNPQEAHAFVRRAYAWRMQGDLDKSLADYTTAIRLAPYCSSGYVYRALVWELKGQHERAVADYTDAIRVNPRDLDAWNGRAMLYATSPHSNLRDANQAISDARRAGEICEWRRAEVLDTLAAAYAAANQFDEAVTWQTKAVAMIDTKDRADYESRLKQYVSRMP